MAREKKSTQPKANNGANLGFEQKMWQAADKMRGHMDASEYKHVVLGLIFLKYISDAFQERYEALKKEPHADPEDRDEYTAENVFWVPKEARWAHLQAHAKQTTIGKLIDEAMEEIERTNPSLKGVLPKDYNRPSLDGSGCFLGVATTHSSEAFRSWTNWLAVVGLATFSVAFLFHALLKR